MYGVNKLAKTYETRQSNHPVQQQQQQQYQPQRQSREYSPDASHSNNSGGYSDARNSSPPPFGPQQQRGIDQSSPQEYWYLNNNNEWMPLPREYANMRTSAPQFDQRSPQFPIRQQQLDFEYPQQQGCAEEFMEPRRRSMVSPDQMQQGLGLLMNAAGSKGGKKGKDDKMSEVLSMFTK